MKISILTLFPQMFESLNHSIIGKAIEKNILEINIINIRDYSADKHSKCDDTPYGGGAGMVMTAQPIVDCINSVDPDRTAHRIYLSPRGETLSTPLAQNYAANYEHILLLCGHYEGIDERIISLCIDNQLSIGDYILTGGELAAMVFVDCISRFIPKVLGKLESALEESFSDNLLEYPQYTKPNEFRGLSVPEILISGHHANIKKWRLEQSQSLTKIYRPDLLARKATKE